MKKIFTLVYLICFTSALFAQTYSTGKRSLTFIDNGRSDREVPTDLYYPANTSGNDVPLATGSLKFPVVVFGHGFLIGASSYKWLTDSLVKRGYIVAFPTTEGGILPNHLDFGTDLAFLCGRITSLNDSAGSFLYQRVIKKSAVGGHSMGGGASFLAVPGLRPYINAVFNFAAAETTPPASAAAVLDFKPTLIFSGSGDCVAPDSVQENIYNNIFLACKTYVNITDALHCQFTNNDLICSLGQLAIGCGIPSISNNTVYSKTTSLLLPFLDYYLKDICVRGTDFVAAYNNLTGVTEKRRSCLPFPSCGVTPLKLTSFTGNVANDKINLLWKTEAEYDVDHFVVERSADGISFKQLSEVKSAAVNGGNASYNSFDAYPFAGNNFYRLKIVDANGSFRYSNVIRLETTKKNIAVTQLFPNPVKDMLHVQVQSEKQQSVSTFIYDVAGKQIQKGTIQLNAGINETDMTFSKLATGTYILQYRNGQGIILGTYKIVKD